MKRYLLLVLLFGIALHSKGKAAQHAIAVNDTIPQTLPDGQYYGDVDYFNYASSISATYGGLKFKVREGIVRVIYLNNGGILHDGINSEGYLYTGGKLKVNKDKRNGRLEYTAQVSISNGANIYSYKITITKEAVDDK